MKRFAAAEWDRAKRALASAKLLVEEDHDAAASRAYYAAFYAVTALFAMEGKTYAKHTAIRGAFHKELIHTGRLPPELGRDYDVLMDLRDEADYGGASRVPVENARIAVAKAQAILEAVGKACPELRVG